MNINLTLIGQTIMFAMFVWFCMKFVWPPLVEAMAARKKAIEDGLKAAELGKEEHALAQKNAEDLIETSKTQAAEIIANADKQASVMIDTPRVLHLKKQIKSKHKQNLSLIKRLLKHVMSLETRFPLWLCKELILYWIKKLILKLIKICFLSFHSHYRAIKWNYHQLQSHTLKRFLKLQSKVILSRHGALFSQQQALY